LVGKVFEREEREKKEFISSHLRVLAVNLQNASKYFNHQSSIAIRLNFKTKTMSRKLLLFLFILLPFMQVFSQSKLGEVATVYINTTSLDSSAALYEKLGFKKIAANEYPAPWVQVSDGSLLIMLRKDPKPYMGLTFYSQDVDGRVAQLEKDGVVFSQKPGANDPIKRYSIKTPGGFTIVLSNNLGGFAQPTGKTLLTMDQKDYTKPASYPNSLSGVFGELAIPVTDMNQSVAFWTKLGFQVKANMKEPYPHAILSDGLMIVGLHQTTHFTFPAITYFGVGSGPRIEALKKAGLKNFMEMAGPNNQALTTWEGQHFFVFELGN
jgi:predicted lactoylglutathione lyase